MTTNLTTDLATNDDVDWAGTLSRLEVLRDHCGELCDTNKPVSVNPGDFMGTVTSKVIHINIETSGFALGKPSK